MGGRSKTQMTQLMFTCPNRRSCVTPPVLLLQLTTVGVLQISWVRTKEIIEVLFCTGNWTSFEDETA